MTNNQQQKILTAVIETYGTSVTRKNLIEFEQAGRGNCAFIGALYRSGRGTYQLPAKPVKQSKVSRQEYMRAWRAKNPESPEQRIIRLTKQRARKANESPEKRNIRLAKSREYGRVAYHARRDAQTPAERKEDQRKGRIASRAFRARMSPEEYAAVRAKERARYANVEERRERDRRSLKPYPKSYRDKVLANYAAKGLTISQRMLDELDGKRDPQTPPLFRRA